MFRNAINTGSVAKIKILADFSNLVSIIIVLVSRVQLLRGY
jgi:hypothetical protein